MLVTFADKQMKIAYLKGGSNLKDKEETRDIRISNDMTPIERENEKKLFAEAKERENNPKGKYRLKVRGPPSARRIVQEKIDPEN
ncbi:hypothetical protein DPMN_014770 [Dreissena polymorpha]|uniref:Uncharacterized protein n=1 Tax=Dreissena polymorpha TaxID=45954 RepID=A0A9D4S4W8_DREPO|nr:hypothetical protein DPMN_014770 [Dreissena polymorpha]